MLAGDLEKTGAEIGTPLPLAIFEPGGVTGLGLPRPRSTRWSWSAPTSPRGRARAG